MIFFFRSSFTWKYDIFFKCSEKMVFPKNSRLNMIFFVISGKMVFLFSRKYDIFSLGGKWKEMIFIKSAWNMVFSAYMRRRHRHDISPPMHLRVTSPASPKKMIFILKDMVFLLKYLTDTLERVQEAATRNLTQEKVFLEILQNSQEKTCARASFLIRLQT